MTQEQLAAPAGITTGSVARLELEQSSPGCDTVRRLPSD